MPIFVPPTPPKCGSCWAEVRELLGRSAAVAGPKCGGCWAEGRRLLGRSAAVAGPKCGGCQQPSRLAAAPLALRPSKPHTSSGDGGAEDAREGPDRGGVGRGE